MLYSALKLILFCYILIVYFTGCSSPDTENISPAVKENRQGIRVGVIDIEETADASVVPGMLDDHGFRFIRVVYRDWNNRWVWATDNPTADDNLQEAIEKTTKLDIAGQYLALSLTDEKIFEHPIMYLTEPGYWMINETEVRMLREYFDRGGFVIFDDFHYEQWYNFYNNIKLVFPDREPVELKPDHPIWSVYYNIDPVEVPSTKQRVGRYEDRYFGSMTTSDE